jgi:hypothetical protein
MKLQAAPLRPMIRILACLGCLSIAIPAMADSTTGIISGIITVKDSSTVLFYQSGTRSALPACGAANPTRWAIAPTTLFGQSVLSVLLTAYALHKSVSIVGFGACPDQSDTESVKYMQIND